MPKIDVDVELDASGVSSQARAAASEAGSAIESEVSSAGKAAADAAGSAIESGVESGARSGAKTAGASIDSEVGSAGRSAGDAAGAAIEAGVEAGADAGADGALEAIEGIASRAQAVFGALGVGAAVAGIDKLAGSAAEAQSYMSRLEASARANSVSGEAMSSTYSGLVGVLGETDRSVETAGNMFALCGDDQRELERLTTSLTGAYSQFGDGMPIEALAEAANETAKVGTVTGSFADALNWTNTAVETFGDSMDGNVAAQDAWYESIDAGMSKEDAFNAALAACSTEGERQGLVLQALNAAYGDAGTAYKEANADMIAYNQSQDELSSSMNGLGEELMPLVTDMREFGSDVLDGAVRPAVQWLLDNMPTLGPILTGLLTTIGLLAIATNAQTIASTAQQIATNGVAVAQGALNAVMNANPIAIVVALIAGLVVAIMGLWNNSEAFRSFVTSAFEAISSVASTVINAIVSFFTVTVPSAIGTVTGFFQGLWDTVVSVFEGALSTVSGFVSGVVNFFTVQVPGAVGSMISSASQIPGKIASFLGDAISSATSFVADFGAKAISAASDFVGNLIDGISGLPGRVLSIGEDIVRGIWDGISGMGSWLMDQIGGFASGIVDGIAGFFGIASPSKVMRRLFRWVPVGAAMGIDDEADVVTDAMRDMGEGAMGGLVLAGQGGSSHASPYGVAASVQGALTSRQAVASGTITQEINFNQPVQTPDQVARTMRTYGRYGLAGVV